MVLVEMSGTSHGFRSHHGRRKALGGGGLANLIYLLFLLNRNRNGASGTERDGIGWDRDEHLRIWEIPYLFCLAFFFFPPPALLQYIFSLARFQALSTP